MRRHTGGSRSFTGTNTRKAQPNTHNHFPRVKRYSDRVTSHRDITLREYEYYPLWDTAFPDILHHHHWPYARWRAMKAHTKIDVYFCQQRGLKLERDKTTGQAVMARVYTRSVPLDTSTRVAPRRSGSLPPTLAEDPSTSHPPDMSGDAGSVQFMVGETSNEHSVPSPFNASTSEADPHEGMSTASWLHSTIPDMSPELINVVSSALAAAAEQAEYAEHADEMRSFVERLVESTLPDTDATESVKSSEGETTAKYFIPDNLMIGYSATDTRPAKEPRYIFLIREDKTAPGIDQTLKNHHRDNDLATTVQKRLEALEMKAFAKARDQNALQAVHAFNRCPLQRYIYGMVTVGEKFQFTCYERAELDAEFGEWTEDRWSKVFHLFNNDRSDYNDVLNPLSKTGYLGLWDDIFAKGQEPLDDDDIDDLEVNLDVGGSGAVVEDSDRQVEEDDRHSEGEDDPEWVDV